MASAIPPKQARWISMDSFAVFNPPSSPAGGTYRSRTSRNMSECLSSALLWATEFGPFRGNPQGTELFHFGREKKFPHQVPEFPLPLFCSHYRTSLGNSFSMNFSSTSLSTKPLSITFAAKVSGLVPLISANSRIGAIMRGSTRGTRSV